MVTAASSPPLIGATVKDSLRNLTRHSSPGRCSGRSALCLLRWNSVILDCFRANALMLFLIFFIV